MIKFEFCPQCGRKLTKSDFDAAPYCRHCKRPYYNNSSPCACIMAVKNGKTLVARRALAPYKGAYDTVGGFLHSGEDPKHGAIREFKEETGLDVKIIDFLDIYPDQYGKDGDHTINIVYIGEVLGGSEQAQDDVAALEWIEIENLPVPSGGFASTDAALRDLKVWYKRNH